MSGLTFVEVGSTLGGRYRLESRLGGSEIRAVYQAVDESRGQVCALELFSVEALPKAQRGALVQRIEELRDIEHPQLAMPFHGGTNNALDLFFVASPLLDGADLGAIAKQSGPVPPEQVVTWMTSAAVALDALRKHGLEHGQLAASSLFLERDEDGKPLIIVLDAEKAGLVKRSSALDAHDLRALGNITKALLGADQPKVKLPNAFARWSEKMKEEDAFSSASAAAQALAIALGVRQGDDGENRKIVDYEEPPELDETLRPEELDEEEDAEPQQPAVISVIDPLGDTHAGGLDDAAEGAVEQARKSAPERPKVPIAATVNMTEQEKEAMLAGDALPPIPTTGSAGKTALIVAVTLAVVAAIAFVATR